MKKTITAVQGPPSPKASPQWRGLDTALLQESATGSAITTSTSPISRTQPELRGEHGQRFERFGPEVITAVFRRDAEITRQLVKA